MLLNRGIVLLVTFIQHFLFCLNLLSGPHGPPATCYYKHFQGSLLLPKVKTFKPSSDFSNKQMYVKDVFKIQGLYILYTLRTPENIKINLGPPEIQNMFFGNKLVCKWG